MLSLLAVAAVGACSAGEDEANAPAKATFPANGKPITMLVSFGAGGATDVMARMVADRMKKILGTNVAVVNRPGAGTQIGLTEAAGAKPDGYTIAATNIPSAVVSYLDPNGSVGYKRESFIPVATMATLTFTMPTLTKSGYNSFEEVIAALKAKPRSVSLAAGAIDDLLTVLQLEKATGVDFNQVPFEGGGADKIRALLGGQLDVILSAPGEVIQHVKSGDAKILVVFGKERLAVFPDAPTAIELGYDLDLVDTSSYSLPAGTPKEIVDVYEKAFEQISKDPEFIKLVESQGRAVVYEDGEALAARWKQAEVNAKPLIDEAAKGAAG